MNLSIKQNSLIENRLVAKGWGRDGVEIWD